MARPTMPLLLAGAFLPAAGATVLKEAAVAGLTIVVLAEAFEPSLSLLSASASACFSASFSASFFAPPRRGRDTCLDGAREGAFCACTIETVAVGLIGLGCFIGERDMGLWERGDRTVIPLRDTARGFGRA